MIKTKTAYKYENYFKDLYKFFQMWTNVTATLQTGVFTNIMNIRNINIKPYNDPNLE